MHVAGRLAPPLIAAIILLTGCRAATTVNTVWKAPEPPKEPFKTVLALVANASPAERRAGEDELVSSIKSAPATASYTLIPDEDLKDREKVRAIIKQHGFDGVVVLRLVSSDTRTTYIPPTYGAYTDPFAYRGPDFTYRGGYTQTDTVVTVETSVYEVRHEQLIWAGSSQTYNPGSISDLVRQVARGAAEEVRRQGLMPGPGAPAATR